MPAYTFSCEKHGPFSVCLRMNEEHKANCPECGKEGMRIFHPPALHGDLPSKDRRMGKTRAELLDNVAKEGFGSKEWRVADQDANKRWRDAGVKEVEQVGWEPSTCL